MYACMHVCMYVWMCVCKYVCIMEIWGFAFKMLYIPWKYEVLHPNWCKYHGNMRFCIQNAVNTMKMKDSRSRSRGPYHWGGLRDRGPGWYIYDYICAILMVHAPTFNRLHRQWTAPEIFESFIRSQGRFQAHVLAAGRVQGRNPEGHEQWNQETRKRMCCM